VTADGEVDQSINQSIAFICQRAKVYMMSDQKSQANLVLVARFTMK